MKGKFYLSYVYDGEGYIRHDFTYFNSLMELDSYTTKFNGPSDIFDEFDFEPNGHGKVHIIFEDIEKKKEQLMKYSEASEEEKEEVNRMFSYAHIIPILYANERLANFEICLERIRARLNDPKTISGIFDNVSNQNNHLRTNKRYIFQGQTEHRLLANRNDYPQLMYYFYKRLAKIENENTRYFYCRVLMGIYDLSIKLNKGFNERDLWPINLNYDPDFEERTQIEEASGDMESFYAVHDLDRVIKLSLDSSKPIGSEGKGK